MQIRPETFNTIVREMVEGLRNKYPNVIYVPTRCQFWCDRILIPDQDVRNVFAENKYELDYLTEIAGWRVSNLLRDVVPDPEPSYPEPTSTLFVDPSFNLLKN